MKFTVGKKLWLGFMSIVIIMIVIGTVGFLAIKKVNEQYTFLIEDRMHKVILLERQKSDQNDLVKNIRGYMLYGSESYINELKEISQRTHERLDELDIILNSSKMKELLSETHDATEEYEKVLQNIIDETKAGNDEQALKTGTNGTAFQEVISKNLDAMINFQREQQEQLEKDVASYTSSAVLMMGILILIGIIASVAITIIISGLIRRPVTQMTNALAEVSEGNFSIEEVKIKNRDEIGDMSVALNRMVGDLRGIIDRAKHSALQLAAQSEELSASAEESLAASEMVAEISEKNLQTSESQANIVNQSTVSMGEMVTAIDVITHDNEEMLNSSEDVARLVKEGSSLMGETKDQMTNISQTIGDSMETINQMAKHTENIRNVTSMITAIAEQTNLLALNAAIEAARAGEHGKGFAVVAEEVRNLAEQSKQSTQEIGRMIDTIIEDVTKVVSSTGEGRKRVDEGLALTEKTNSIFMDIEHATSDVSEKVSTVSAAIEEIRAMTDEVTDGARQVEELAVQAAAEAQSTSAATEQQLAANEEITSSSQTLAQLAEELQHDMGRFQV
ncbi:MULTISPECIES: methyl-accepting chemotaxis protein [unclassified Sporosarcina]|uniref:methyl-accepting chemotaxis protein n=1 Tax=unclassified Sporosarcina TaxID=2647733 RepID=UPI001304654D|nr:MULTISPECIES: methyl-accepting chemotaxis protein [unclassified Sporosarcina]